MTARLVALGFDAFDPQRLALFWAGILGRDVVAGPGGVALPPDDDTGFPIRFLPTTAARVGPNQMHFDLTSASLEAQQQTVARALELGGRHLDVGQGPDADHVVLADPEGNEFCVIEPGNSFLADCGFVGALSCDGEPEVGYFWSEALGWPLVWDQDLETAIRSPHGGPIISWGGPPVAQRTARNRLRLDLVPTADGDLEAEVDRLLELGATRTGVGGDEPDAIALADPGGNEFCLRTAG